MSQPAQRPENNVCWYSLCVATKTTELNTRGCEVFMVNSTMKTLLVIVIISVLFDSINTQTCWYDDNDQLTRCHDYSVHKGPLQIDRNVSTLLMVDSIIPTLTSGFFSDLKNIKSLNMYSCNIHTIEPNAFNGLDKLGWLSIGDGRLSEVKEGAFNSLPSLYQLSLNNNSIVRIESKAFHELIKLNILDLSYNRLKNLNCEIFDNLINLQYLNLMNNKLRALPEDCFRDSNKFKLLLISGNKIKSFDAEKFLTYNPYLGEIDFSNNPWECHSLVNVINVLKENSVEIKIRDSEAGTNKMIIDGVACIIVDDSYNGNCESKEKKKEVIGGNDGFPGLFEEDREFTIFTRTRS